MTRLTRYSLLICALRWTSSSSPRSLACGLPMPRAHVAVKSKKEKNGWLDTRFFFLLDTVKNQREDFRRWWRLIVAWNTYADPWVFQGFVRRDSLIGIHCEHLIDEILGFGRYRVPLGARVLQAEKQMFSRWSKITSDILFIDAR